MLECRERGSAEELSVKYPAEQQCRGQSFAAVLQSVFWDAVCRDG